jgi:hypothetical protein
MRDVEDAQRKVAMEAKGGEGAPAFAQPGKTRKRPFFDHNRSTPQFDNIILRPDYGRNISEEIFDRSLMDTFDVV